MTNNPLNQAKQRALRYWYTDGIVETVFGGLCLLLAAYFWIQSVLPEDTPLSSLMTASFILIIIGGVAVGRKLMTVLKERLTYARTGYVAFPHPSPKRRLFTGLMALCMAMVIAALFASAPASLQWIPAPSGLLFGAAWLYFGHRVGLTRFYVVAMFYVLCGAGISLAGWGEDIGLAAFYALMGLANLVSGGITLIRYLHQGQPISAGEDAEERL